MLAAQRRAFILERLAAEGAVTVGALAAACDVAEMTIRRDLDALHAAGRLQKVHGGATASKAITGEPMFAAKAALAAPAKAAIAREAAALVAPGMVIALTAGTTTHAIATELVQQRGLTVITNSIRVAEVFHDVPIEDIEVIVTGGVRTPSDALVGPLAIDAIEALHIDICFMGVYGIDADAGFTTPNLLEADTNRAFADASGEFVVVADSSKWGTVGMRTIATLDEASTVITDTGLSRAARKTLSTHAGTLVLAKPDRSA